MELDGLPSTVIPPPGVTLTFDLLTLKPHHYVSWSRYIFDIILVKLAPVVTRYCIYPVFGSYLL